MTQVSGLVLYLSEDEALAARALQAASRRARLELGQAADPRRVPAVLEETSGGASKETIRWLEGLDGVIRVEVAFVSVEDLEEQQERGGISRATRSS